jgi:hypothetical protein
MFQMPKITGPTLQKRHGGHWVALSPGRGKVYASHQKFNGLLMVLKKKKISTKKVIFSKVDKPGQVSVYQN